MSFIFKKNVNPLNSEVNKAIREEIKVTEQDYDYGHQFVKKLKLCAQNYV